MHNGSFVFINQEAWKMMHISGNFCAERLQVDWHWYRQKFSGQSPAIHGYLVLSKRHPFKAV